MAVSPCQQSRLLRSPLPFSLDSDRCGSSVYRRRTASLVIAKGANVSLAKSLSAVGLDLLTEQFSPVQLRQSFDFHLTHRLLKTQPKGVNSCQPERYKRLTADTSSPLGLPGAPGTSQRSLQQTDEKKELHQTAGKRQESSGLKISGQNTKKINESKVLICNLQCKTLCGISRH